MATVRAYLSALNRQDARAVCSTFSPQLRRQLHGFQEPTCLAAVHEVFTLDDRGEGSRLRRARLLGVTGMSWNAATGVETVASHVAEDFGCHGTSVPEPHCRAATVRRADVVYLLRRGAGWAILKPGILLRTFEVGQRGEPEESLYLPPGDAATVASPAQIGTPSFDCGASGVSASDPTGDVRRQDGYRRTQAPWLDITGLTISRPSDSSLCFTITLAAPPRAASAYRIFAGPASELDPAELVEIRVDGLGLPHVIVGGRAARPSPGFQSPLQQLGLTGSSLQFVVSTPGRAQLPPLIARVDAQSIQGSEPLLVDRVSAEDVAPNEACLEYPSGKLLGGECGVEPSG